MLLQRRFIIIVLSTFLLFLTLWLELFVQKRHYLLGLGINRTFLFLLINAHLMMVAFLLYLIIRHSIKLVLERRKGVPGSIFQRNLIFAFVLLSVIPAGVIFFAAGSFITKSIDQWFRARLGVGLASGTRLHQLHTRSIRALLRKRGEALVVSLRQASCDVSGRAIVDGAATVARDNGFEECESFVWPIKQVLQGPGLHHEAQMWRVFRTLNDRSIKSLKVKFTTIIHACTEPRCFDFYGSLYWVQRVGDYVCIVAYRYPAAIRQALLGLDNAREDYRELQAVRRAIFLNYYFTFAALVLLILFLAIWCSFYLARGLSKPIQALLDATEKIRLGRWDVRVEEVRASDLQLLAHGFNQMAIAVQEAHDHLEAKNREMLAILENISSSVFFFDTSGRILFYNAAAQAFASDYMNIDLCEGRGINDLGAEVGIKISELRAELVKADKQQFVKEVSFAFASGARTFMIYARILGIGSSAKSLSQGMLVVFEDITEVMKHNKLKTWQRAAQQMAHEIKNPLTPIQLATQRLQRRFGKAIKDDAIFFDCTNTILEQVKILKDLVAHFSQFASMPAPVIGDVSINDLVNEVLCLYRVGYPDIDFIYHPYVGNELLRTDRKKLQHVLINLLDNSVRVLQKDDYVALKTISITVSFDATKRSLHIVFQDSGPGISDAIKASLFLPYVSTEKKNMGLGLAIVQDIIAQLGGSVSLIPCKKGAVFEITLPC